MTPPRRASRVVALILVFALLGSLATPQPAQATVPVWDYVSWVLQFIQTYLAWVQRAQAYYVQAKHWEATVKSLRSFGRNGYWESLNGLLGQLDQMYQTTENIGYLSADAVDAFNRQFPGYQVDEEPLANGRARLATAHETLRILMRSMNRMTYANTHSQTALERLTEMSQKAETPVEEAEVNNMGNVVIASELNKLHQDALMGANVGLVQAAVDVQDRMTQRALIGDWMSFALPVPNATDFHHFDPIAPVGF